VPAMLFMIPLTRLSIRLKINAQKKPSTLNPDTSLDASRIMIALITNRNNPRVMIVTGKVKITSIGFISRLRMANTIASIRAVAKSLTFTPGNRYAETITANAFTNRRIIKFMAINLREGNDS
jgi:hypothetical protein